MFNENLIRALAQEKAIDVEKVISALEDALATAARKYYKTREPIQTVLNRDEEGTVDIYVVKQVVGNDEEIEDPLAQIPVDEAKKLDPDAEEGGTLRLDYITKAVVDVVSDPLTEIRQYEAKKIDGDVETGDNVRIPLTKPPAELGRIAAQSAKQVLYQKVREAEREKVYREFKDQVGTIVNGYVKRFERGDMIVDLNGRTEGAIPRSQQSRAERYSQGDRIRAVIVDVHTQPKGPQVILSRTDSLLLMRLFEMEVPEIYDGTVVIKDAVREPGERAKIAVASRERDVDPVGACVGMKGSRVQSIIRELRGEKIDIIPWDEDLVVYAQNALAPARITRVSVTSGEEELRPQLDVIVDDDQLSLAIGKRGLNVRLAAELIGARIDIKSEDQVKDEVADALSAMLHSAMEEARAETNVHDIDGLSPDWADMLEEAGYDDLDSILNATPEDLSNIEGIDLESAAEIIAIAEEFDLEAIEEEGLPVDVSPELLGAEELMEEGEFAVEGEEPRLVATASPADEVEEPAADEAAPEAATEAEDEEPVAEDSEAVEEESAEAEAVEEETPEAELGEEADEEEKEPSGVTAKE
ncbi:MAG: transcription termination factor NusA [Thermoanaerobaculia bacterium]|nr:transcription termination factor NusA [Thermoanaerobaculia bacterium]